jgi:hypothetical protein
VQQLDNSRIAKIVTISQLPLAIYRELAAHLQQVDGVTTEVIMRSEKSGKQVFDYQESQVESLRVEYPQELKLDSQERIEEIIEYYSHRYSRNV